MARKKKPNALVTWGKRNKTTIKVTLTGAAAVAAVQILPTPGVDLHLSFGVVLVVVCAWVYLRTVRPA